MSKLRVKGRKAMISISIDEALVRQVTDLADAQNVSRSRFIEDLIRDGIEQEAMMVRAFTDPVLRDSLLKAFSQREVIQALAHSMVKDVEPDQLELFARGLELVGNYGAAFERTGGDPVKSARATEAAMKPKRKPAGGAARKKVRRRGG